MLYELRQLLRRHGERTILDIDHLVVDDGRITGLIGANGAGKTTLLQLLAFLDQPSGGNIAFRGQPVESREEQLLALRRQVVLVDQYPILFTGSVRRNLEFGLKIRGISAALREQRILAALEMVGMGRFLNARAEKLSGGETKRIALARALALHPEVLLCDEPTANVDGEHQEVILNILERANREERISVIFSTHALDQAERLADNLVILKDGRLSRLSRANVWPALIIDGRTAVITGRGRREVKIPLESCARREPGTVRHRLFFDPARLRLLPLEATVDEKRMLPGTVLQLAADQGGVRVIVDVGIPLEVHLELSDYRRRPPCIGESIWLQMTPGAVVVE